ncbi:PAS-domain containing protein [Labrenzia sp. PHM005]|uniref:PAS-domain containing protein n=1 Tax=Labrenzia sp. PHM005 TaxID=2590016 RepID=UPI001140154A|nr:PAS-domain containing protein [Labrenzia sp. PHM005]QDG74666.1 diguanylate cyclase [Labrenzia sp. PHM005]
MIVQSENETERLKALRTLQLINSGRLPEYDAIVELAAAVFDCPFSLISFIEEKDQWFKACCGMELVSSPREISFCQHAILSSDLFVVPNALEDDRFKDNPLVVGDPKIRFYAGCPISLDGKHRLGTLCVIDTRPHTPTASQLKQLRHLGTVVEGLIKTHQATVETEQAVKQADAERNTALLKGELLEEVASVSGVGAWELCLKSNNLTWTAKTREIHEVPEDFQPTVELALAFYPPDSRSKISHAIEQAIEQKIGWDVDVPFTTATGRNIWVRAVGRPIFEDGEVTRLIGGFQDITDQKKTETSIRAAEATQRTTLESLSEGILLISRSGNIQSINAAGADFLGYSPEDLTGSRIQDLDIELRFEGNDKTKSAAILRTISSHPERVNDIVACVARKGTSDSYWLRVNASPVEAENEFGLDGVVVSLKDITEQRRQEETLKAVFDNVSAGIACFDKNMHFSACNNSFQQMLSFPEELIERKAHKLDFMRYQAARGDYGQGDPEQLAQERYNNWDLSVPTQEERVQANGQVLDIRSTALPDGGVVFNVFDITERKQTEQKILQAEAIQRTTLEALSEGVLLIDRNGNIQSANPAVVDLLRYPLDELIGRNVDQLDLDMTCDIDGIGHCNEPLSMSVRDPHVMTDILVRFTPAFGYSTSWLRLNARSIEDDSRSGFDGVVVSLTNMTETKVQADTLQVIFDNFPGGVVHYDEHFQLASCNSAYGELLGYPQELVDRKLHILDYLKFTAEKGNFGPGDPEQLALEKFSQLKSPDPYNFDRSTADGKFLEVRGTPLPTGGAILNFFDVTDRKKMEKELAESEQLARHRFEELETVLANMRQGVSVFDERGRITLWNRQYIDIFGKPDGEVVKGKTLRELIDAEKARGDFEGDVQEHIQDLMMRMSAGEVVRSKFAHKNGKIVSVIHAPLPGGGWIGTHEDITLREQAAAKITYAAHHDSLTGLANRTLFNATLNDTLANARIQGTTGNLLLMDLDKFKPVNDTYGHDVGDELLKQVAIRFRDCVRSSDLVARLGGDEFAIILPGTGPNSAGTAEIASRIVESIRRPFKIYAEKIEIGISVGIAPILVGDADTSTIIKKADIALYEVKNQGRNNFRFYDENSTLRPIKTLHKAGKSSVA